MTEDAEMDKKSTRPIRILFVCMGNICRSPLAEGIFRSQVAEMQLSDRFEIDSAGTGSWHVGQAPNPRMQSVAEANGVSLRDQQARQFIEGDLEYFDHILAMDRDNLHDMLYFDRKNEYGQKVRLFREVDPDPENFQVPDPYYGGADGFVRVHEIVERTSASLLRKLVSEYDLTP